jgi:hypothetical protein
MEVLLIPPVLKRIVRFLPRVGRDSTALKLVCKQLYEQCKLYQSPSFFTPQQCRLLATLDRLKGSELNYPGGPITEDYCIGGGHALGRSSVAIYKAFRWCEEGKKVAICIPHAHYVIYTALLGAMKKRFPELAGCEFEVYDSMASWWNNPVYPLSKCVVLIFETKTFPDTTFWCDRVIVDNCRHWLRNGTFDNEIPIELSGKDAFMLAIDSTANSKLFDAATDPQLSSRPSIQLDFHSTAGHCVGCRTQHRLNPLSPPAHYQQVMQGQKRGGKTIIAVNDLWSVTGMTKNPRRFSCPVEPSFFGMRLTDGVISINKTMSPNERTSLMLLFAAQQEGTLILPASFLRQAIPLHCSRLVLFNTFHGGCRQETSGKFLDAEFVADIMNTVQRRDSPYTRLNVSVYDSMNANFLYFYGLQYANGLETVSRLTTRRKTRKFLANASLEEIREFCTKSELLRQLC